jgi:putative methyltransferase (TIGR04325 family)
MTIKSIIKNLLPPVITKILPKKSSDWGWFGEYETWEDAKKKSLGYEQNYILDKKINTFLRIKSNESVYELDTLLYNEPILNFQLLYVLSYISLEQSPELTIIDFGGSLGSAYYWVKNLLPKKIKYNWFIIEQKHIVKAGQEQFEKANLKFIENFEAYHVNNLKMPDLLVLCGALQCIESNAFIFDEIEKHKYPYVFIDRTPFFDDVEKEESITIQKIPAHYYEQETTFPCRIFNLKTLITKLENYELIFNSPSFDNVSCDFYGNRFNYRCLFFKRMHATNAK